MQYFIIYSKELVKDKLNNTVNDKIYQKIGFSIWDQIGETIKDINISTNIPSSIQLSALNSLKQSDTPNSI